MGKIKQGILGGFSGKVGTVVGSYWNGIFYMKGLPQSYKKSRSGNQKMQQGYFKELVTLSMSLSNEDLEFIYPKKPKGMSRRNLWEAVTYYRDQHPDDYPVILVANITQQKLFLIASPVTLKRTGKQSFEVNVKPYGNPRDEFSGFMFVTSQNRSRVGIGTLGVINRPARPPKKTKDSGVEKQPESGTDPLPTKSLPTIQNKQP